MSSGPNWKKKSGLSYGSRNSNFSLTPNFEYVFSLCSIISRQQAASNLWAFSSTSWESSDYFLHSMSFFLPKQEEVRPIRPQFALLPVSNAVDIITRLRKEGLGMSCFILVPKLFLNCLVDSHPLFSLSGSGGYHLILTSRALRKGGWEVVYVGASWSLNCFFNIVTFTAWGSENCHGRTKCAAVSFSSQEKVRKEEEGEPQLLGIRSNFNGAGSKIVEGFLCLPLHILYLLCSCVITFLTTHRLILFNFVCVSFSFPSHILFALLAVNLPSPLYPAMLKD